MLMYHPKVVKPISIHPEQAPTMRSRGWTEKPPTAKPKKRKAKLKPEPIPAETIDEVNDG